MGSKKFRFENKEDKSQFENLISNIQPIQRINNGKLVFGSVVLTGSLATQWGCLGGPFEPNKKYVMANQPLYYNTRSLLMDAYKKGGKTEMVATFKWLMKKFQQGKDLQAKALVPPKKTSGQ